MSVQGVSCSHCMQLTKIVASKVNSSKMKRIVVSQRMCKDLTWQRGLRQRKYNKHCYRVAKLLLVISL